METKLTEWPRVKGIYLRDDGQIFSEIGITFRKIFAKGRTDKYGYYATCYIPKSELGSKKSFFIHRIVCETFHPNENFLDMEVNHIDGNKLNNHPSNLEWSTKSHNRKHAYSIGLNPIVKKQGSNNGKSKLDNIQVSVIKSIRSELTQATLAAYFKVSQTNIGCILNGKNWMHV
jgi:hypothetical protein